MRRSGRQERGLSPLGPTDGRREDEHQEMVGVQLAPTLLGGEKLRSPEKTLGAFEEEIEKPRRRILDELEPQSPGSERD